MSIDRNIKNESYILKTSLERNYIIFIISYFPVMLTGFINILNLNTNFLFIKVYNYFDYDVMQINDDFEIMTDGLGGITSFISRTEFSKLHLWKNWLNNFSHSFINPVNLVTPWPSHSYFLKTKSNHTFFSCALFFHQLGSPFLWSCKFPTSHALTNLFPCDVNGWKLKLKYGSERTFPIKTACLGA